MGFCAARIAELVEITARYELAFWDRAHRGGGWPGLPEWSEREPAS